MLQTRQRNTACVVFDDGHNVSENTIISLLHLHHRTMCKEIKPKLPSAAEKFRVSSLKVPSCWRAGAINCNSRNTFVSRGYNITA